MRGRPVVVLAVLALVAAPVVLHVHTATGFEAAVPRGVADPSDPGDPLDPADYTGSTPAVANATDPTTGSSVESDPGPDERICPPDAARGGSDDGAGATAANGTGPSAPEAARIVELYPNPTTDGNVGEYAVLAFPAGTAVGNWTLTDGHATASLPNETVTGRVAVTMAPEETRSIASDPVLELEGRLRAAVEGDELRLREGDRTVDAVAYDRAPTAETWYRTGPDATDGTWWPRDATCLPPAHTRVDEATAFVLPDAPETPLEVLRAADERVLLAGYTFTSEAVAVELRDAARRGVDVRVLVEGGPVGGAPAATAAVLDDLAAAGATVRVVGGEGARYRYHHAKYAVVDDRAMVLTENWKPAGVGGAASRGWGAVVADPEIAAALERVYASDFEGRDTTTWTRYARNASFVDDDPADGQFPARTDPETVPVESAEVVVAPDNAEPRLRRLLRDAEESILVTQVRIGDPSFSLLEETIAAAERGVEVRILLDATWYVEAENRALADRLEALAADGDLPLEVRLADSGPRFEKVHAKGVVIDGETAIVGSANWNDNALWHNREVVLVLHGDAVGAYYEAVFEGDWGDESWPLPVGLVVAVLTTLVGAWAAGTRYVTIEPGSDPEAPPGSADRDGPA